MARRRAFSKPELLRGEFDMAVEEIAVLGGGNGAFTTAGDMSLAGNRVRMWTAFPQEFEELFETKTVQVEGFGRTGKAKIDIVTKDLGEAVEGARIIFSPSPAFSQEEIAERVGPYLEDGQVILLSPGSMGSYLFGKVLKENNSWRDIAIAEPGTLAYLTRKTSPTSVLVSGHAVRLPVGVFPAKKTDETVNILRELYPAIHPVENALSVALLNVGPIIHSVLMLLNTGPIEHFGLWDIHNEGTTTSVKKLILAHDRERIALRKALGFRSHHYPFSDHYDECSEDEWMYGRRAHSDLVKSESWKEPLNFTFRYITEDVKCNLALLCSIGDLCQAETPIADSLLKLIGVIVGEDFRKTGRTLDSLGLADKSVAEINGVLQEGF
jgi:opine dehydrogenase